MRCFCAWLLLASCSMLLCAPPGRAQSSVSRILASRVPPAQRSPGLGLSDPHLVLIHSRTYHVGDRLDAQDYERAFHRPLPTEAQAAAIRAGYAHYPVYSLRSESAEQKWAALQASRSGTGCCGQARPLGTLTHQDIAALADAGTFTHVPYRPPLSPWWYVLLGVVALAPAPWLLRSVQRARVRRRLEQIAARRRLALSRADEHRRYVLVPPVSVTPHVLPPSDADPAGVQGGHHSE